MIPILLIHFYIKIADVHITPFGTHPAHYSIHINDR